MERIPPTFKGKLFLSILCLIMFTSIVFLIFFIVHSDIVSQEKFKRVGILGVKNLAATSEFSLVSQNERAIVEVLQDMMKANGDIVYAFVYDVNGNVIASKAKIRVEKELGQDIQAMCRKGETWSGFILTDRGKTFDFVSPIIKRDRYSGSPHKVIGYARIGLSPTNLYIERRMTISVGALIALCIIGVGFILSNILASKISKPAADFIKVIKRSESGDLSVQTTFTDEKDDIGIIGRGINNMIKNLDRLIKAERKRQIELEKERNRTLATVTSIADGILVVSPDNKVILANPAIAEIFGMNENELIGRNVTDCVKHTKLLDFIQKKPTNGKKYELVTTYRRNGEEKIIKAILSFAMDETGKVRDRVLVLRDITKEKEIDRMKDEFVSNVSHELRSPLAAIKGFTTTILRDREMDERTRTEFLKIIEQESDRLTRLIENLLDLAKIRNGKVLVGRKKCQLLNVINEAITNLQAQINKKGLILEKDLPTKLPPISADRDKITEVMINLLSNAVNYTPTGGKITVTVKNEVDHIKVEIKDTGIGIPEKDLPHIFERFYRVERSDFPQKGTGLGLTIVRDVIKAHGGTIHVESKVGKGSRFYFRLPKRPKVS